jgi:hypothetical protein
MTPAEARDVNAAREAREAEEAEAKEVAHRQRVGKHLEALDRIREQREAEDREAEREAERLRTDPVYHRSTLDEPLAAFVKARKDLAAAIAPHPRHGGQQALFILDQCVDRLEALITYLDRVIARAGSEDAGLLARAKAEGARA